MELVINSMKILKNYRHFLGIKIQLHLNNATFVPSPPKMLQGKKTITQDVI